MNGPNGKPLLILNRPGKGRIAMLMSDHVWLWARGFEGGGPHVALLRRLAHWLMKEPQLDEEALTTKSNGNQLTITRQTMGGDPGELSILLPSGKLEKMRFRKFGEGQWHAVLKAKAPGLYQFANGELRTLAHVGPQNPREYHDVTSSTNKLASLINRTGGMIRRVENGTDGVSIPRIVPVGINGPYSGNGWLGLKTTNASILKGITHLPLFAGFFGLTLLLAGLSFMWAREGR